MKRIQPFLLPSVTPTDCMPRLGSAVCTYGIPRIYQDAVDQLRKHRRDLVGSAADRVAVNYLRRVFLQTGSDRKVVSIGTLSPDSFWSPGVLPSAARVSSLTYLSHTCDTLGGMSGGSCFDNRGHLIGVHCGFDREPHEGGSHGNLMYPVWNNETLRELLRKHFQPTTDLGQPQTQTQTLQPQTPQPQRTQTQPP